jgi:hypothetical protein
VDARGVWARLQFAIGLNVRVGTADDLAVRNLLDGETRHTSVDMRTTGLICSIAYQF